MTLKAERIRTLSRVLEKYCAERPLGIIPNVGDVARMDVFRSRIENTSVSTVSEDFFSEAMADLPQLSREWKGSKDRELVMLMNKDKNLLNDATKCTESGDDFVELELAMTYFKCFTCREPIWYPQILKHRHMFEFRHNFPAEDDTDELAKAMASVYIHSWNCGGNRVALHDIGPHVARSVIEAFGLNPDVATARDMDEANRMVECLRCRNNPGGSRYVMRWRRAVRHRVF